MSQHLLNHPLPRDRSCASKARQLIRGAAGPDLSERTLQDLLTVTTELVDNALFHGRGQIRLKLARGRDRFTIEVVDEGEGQVPEIREQPPGGVGGWGLRIVDGLAERWGAFEGTTHVWAEVVIR